MAALAVGFIIDTGRYCELSCGTDSPVRRVGLIGGEHDPMACATGTVECDPLWMHARPDHDGASSGKSVRDLVRSLYVSDDSPAEDG